MARDTEPVDSQAFCDIVKLRFPKHLPEEHAFENEIGISKSTFHNIKSNRRSFLRSSALVTVSEKLRVDVDLLRPNRSERFAPSVIARVESFIGNVFTEDETLYMPESDFRKCSESLCDAMVACQQADRWFAFLSSDQARTLAPKLARLAARAACCASMVDIPDRKGVIQNLVYVGRRTAAATGLQGTAEGAYLGGLLDFQECLGGGGGYAFWEWDREMSPDWPDGAGAAQDCLRRVREAVDRAVKIDRGYLTAASIQEHLAMDYLCSAVIACQSGDDAARGYLEKAKDVAEQINSRRMLASMHIWQGAFRSHPRSSLELRSGYKTKCAIDDFEAGYELYHQEYKGETSHLTAGALLLKAQAEAKKPRRRRGFASWENEFIEATVASTEVCYSDGVDFVDLRQAVSPGR